jgi:hypothetical protein
MKKTLLLLVMGLLFSACQDLGYYYTITYIDCGSTKEKKVKINQPLYAHNLYAAAVREFIDDHDVTSVTVCHKGKLQRIR